MEAIFQLHLLQQLGFADTEIVEIMSHYYKLKYKLNDSIRDR